MAGLDPKLVKAALDAVSGRAAEKKGFVPVEAIRARQGMPPATPPGAPPGGAGMPPEAMGAPPGAAPPMPPAPPGMPPGMPMDPAMMAAMGGAPPGAPPGMPPGGPAGQPVMVNLEDLVALFQQVSGEQGMGETTSPPTTTNQQIGQRLDQIEKKMDALGDMLTQVMGGGPPGVPLEGRPPGGSEGIPPELAAAMAGGAAPVEGMPPGAAAGMPPGAVGAPMPPEAAAGMPPGAMGAPMSPEAAAGMPPGAMMAPAAAANGGHEKSGVAGIAALAAKLRGGQSKS